MKSKLPAGGGRYYVSEKKKSALYAALANPIIKLRLEILRGNHHYTTIEKNAEQCLTTQWKSISQILKIKNP